MSLFDRFRKKLKKDEPIPKKKKVVSDEKIKEPKLKQDFESVKKEKTPEQRIEKEIKKQVPKDSIEKTVASYKIIKEPRITEKASFLAEQGKYVFEVYINANKIQIKKAIESIYNTKVDKVHIVRLAPKKRRLGRSQGWRHGLKYGSKKAIVTLKKGEKIELLPK